MIDVIKAKERYFSDFGWLKTYWLFSFSNYFDPHNIQFGALRVFNDDIVEVQTDIGQDRRADLGIERAHRFVDFLSWAHIGCCTPVILSQVVKQLCVDIIADAEGEQSNIVGRLLRERIQKQ